MYKDFNISRKGLAGSILLFSPLLMYIQILPIKVETQPILAVLMLFFLLRNRFSNIEIILLTILFYTLTIGLITYLQYGGKLIDLLNYLFGPLLFIATPKILKINKTYFFTVHFLLIIVLIFQRFDIYVLSDQLNKFFVFLFARSYTTGDIIPISGIAAEPSYFAQQIIFLHLLAEIGFEKRILKINKKELNILRILLLFYLLMTPSATLFVLIFLCFFSIDKKYIIFFILACTFMVSLRFGYMRFLHLIEDINYINLNNISWDIFFHIDSSGSTRIYKNLIGYLISFEKPFGVGPGNYGFNWDLAFQNYNIETFKINPEIKESYNSGRKSTTYLSNYGSEIGLIGFLFLTSLIVFFLKKLRRTVAQRSTRNVLIFLYFFTCNISSPIPWFLLALYKNDLNIKLQFFSPRKKIIY